MEAAILFDQLSEATRQRVLAPFANFKAETRDVYPCEISREIRLLIEQYLLERETG